MRNFCSYTSCHNYTPRHKIFFRECWCGFLFTVFGEQPYFICKLCVSRCTLFSGFCPANLMPKYLERESKYPCLCRCARTWRTRAPALARISTLCSHAGAASRASHSAIGSSHCPVSCRYVCMYLLSYILEKKAHVQGVPYCKIRWNILGRDFVNRINNIEERRFRGKKRKVVRVSL